MLRTVIWFIGFGLYMILCLGRYLKLKIIQKSLSPQEIESYVHMAAKRWGRYVLRTVGARVEVEGLENLPEGNCLFVGNHQGNLDIPVFLAELDRSIGFIAKKELEKAPILSDWMKELHCVFMDRDNVREAVKSINEGIEFLKAGYSLAIFPEGTRSKGKTLGEFKKGSMKLALKSGVPVVPVTIDGTYKAFEEHNRIRKCNVKVIIGKPINVAALSKDEQNNLAEIIKNIIQKTINR